MGKDKNLEGTGPRPKSGAVILLGSKAFPNHCPFMPIRLYPTLPGATTSIVVAS